MPRTYYLNPEVVETRMLFKRINSVTDLGRSAGIERTYLSRMISGDRPVQPSHACALADVLGVHVAHLVTIGKPDEIAAGMAQDAETAA